MDIGTAVGRKQGLSSQELDALPEFETSPVFGEVEKLVLKYASALTRTPVEVPDDLFAALRSHFSPKQLVELTSAMAWENYRARFDHAFGMASEGYSTQTPNPIEASAKAPVV